MDIKTCNEMKCMKDAWQDWLSCDNEFARNDIDMMKADDGKYFNLVAITAIRL